MTDKVVIITGGGRGIGRAIAISLSELGNIVIVASRTKSEIESVADEINKNSGRAFSFQVDVTKQDQIIDFKNTVVKRFKKINVLINCAGIYGAIGKTWELQKNDWIKALNTNLIGTLTCCQVIIPIMINQSGGKIINIAGGGATMPLPRLSSYACSKAAIVRLTETLAQELQGYNIQINSVAPGTVDTKIQDELLSAGKKAGPWFEPIKALRSLGGGVPMDDITSLIIRLLSPDFERLNGRLISARYDDWKKWDGDKISAIMNSSMFTLCRVDEYSIGLSGLSRK